MGLNSNNDMPEAKCEGVLKHIFKSPDSTKCICGRVSAFPYQYIDYHGLSKQREQIKKLPEALNKIAKLLGKK